MGRTRTKNLPLLYPRLSYKIIGVCYKVHNEIGRYSREKQYADAIEKLLKAEKIRYDRELRIGGSGNVLDFLIEEKIVLELKSVPIITKNDYFQVQRYLHSSGVKLGLLVNFRNKYLRPKRIIKTWHTFE